MRIRPPIPFLFIAIILASCHKDEAGKEADRSDAAQDIAAPVVVPAEAATDPELPIPATEFRRGETYQVMQGDRVVVMNAKPIDDGVWRFPTDSVCRIEPYAQVTVIRRQADPEGGKGYLVRYRRQPTAEPLRPVTPCESSGDEHECPNGTVFFLDETDMSMTVSGESP